MAGAPAPLFDVRALLQMVDRLYPRYLGQIDRDPDSPTYGSCDRHYWMYRLHDFESGVLQQASLGFAALYAAAPLLDFSQCEYLEPGFAEYWRSLATAICKRTADALHRGHGMIDEYYPGERSFPATVFGSYATLKAAHLLGDKSLIAHPGLEATARDFVKRERSPAANQDAAAAAFIGLYSHLREWEPAASRAAVERLLGGERANGTFLEYGGADLGYGTVTLHFLACLNADGAFDATAHMRGLARMLAAFVTPAGRLGGEFASRSTTYFLPFGIIESARIDPTLGGRFAALDPQPVFDKLDDRYLTHYCFPSLAMALLGLASRGAPSIVEPAPSTGWTAEWDATAGILAARCGRSAVHIGPEKGGTFQVEHNGTTHVDCGFRVEKDGQTFATAVIGAAPGATVSIDATGIDVRVRATPMRYGTLVASPLKTVILRGVRLAGGTFNKMFKKILITEPKALTGVALERRIHLDYASGALTVTDAWQGASGVRITRAPANSFRLVPSARFYQAGEEAAHGQTAVQGIRFPAETTFQLATGVDRSK